MSAGKYVELTDQNFQSEVLDSENVVLVDFWAAWCAPCRIMEPIVEELAVDYHGKAKIAKMDVDVHQMAAAQYGIRGIPTMLIFKEGQVVDQVVGAVPKQVVENKLQAHLAH